MQQLQGNIFSRPRLLSEARIFLTLGFNFFLSNLIETADVVNGTVSFVKNKLFTVSRFYPMR